MREVCRKIYGEIYSKFRYIEILEWGLLRLKQTYTKYFSEERKIERKIKKSIIDFYSKSLNREQYGIKGEIEYIKKFGIKMLPYEEIDNSINKLSIEVKWDNDKKLYYVYHYDKKLYFSKKFFWVISVKKYYKSLLKEQHLKSSHRYLSENFTTEKTNCLADIGGAEGIFALENIDKFNKIYIFEYDNNWIEALQFTFSQYKDKVKIIKKFVSDTDTSTTITLDNFQKIIEDKIDFIKMDIEGSEERALIGAKDILENNTGLKLVVCIYHNQEDESKIKEILKDFKLETSENYLLPGDFQNYEPPFFRHGVIRAIKEEKA